MGNLFGKIKETLGKQTHTLRDMSLKNNTGISERRFDISSQTRVPLKGDGGAIVFDKSAVLKVIVLALLLVFFCLLQTTFFTRFRIFNSVPDLILPMVVAVAISENEKWASIFGLVAGIIIDALSGSALVLLPLLYVLVGYIAGLLCIHFFRGSFVVRLSFTVVTSVLRSVVTFIVVISTVGGADLGSALSKAALPELLVNILFAVLPHFIVYISLKGVNKTKKQI